MSCWEILEITPTADEREIRRAYAKKLKVTRPDEDPSGYQALREAFEEAQQLAPYYQEMEQEEEEFSPFEEEALKTELEEAKSEESAVNFSNEFSEVLQKEIQPYDPEAEKDEPEYQFEIQENNETEYSEPDYSESDALLNEIHRIATNEGEVELEKQWRNLYFELNQLPLEQTDYISWQVWRLFQELKIDNPFVWAQWAGHFKWHNDYRFAQYCDLDQLEYVREKVKLARILNKRKITTFNNSTKRIETKTAPILSAIYERFSQGSRYVFTLFYLMLISPFAKTEESRNQSEYTQLTYLMPKLKDIFFHAGVCRTWLLIISIFLLYMPYIIDVSTNVDKSNEFSLVSILVASNIAIFILLIITGISILFVITLKQFIYKPSLVITELNMIIEGIIPLIILICTLIIAPETILDKVQYNLIIITAMAWSLSKSYDEDYSFWASHFMPSLIIAMILASFEILTTQNIYLVLTSIALWININFYIINFRFTIIRKLMEINYKLCNEIPSEGDILKLPINFIASLFYWTFFLPFHTARLYYNVQTKIVFFDIIAFALILAFPFLSFVGNYYALFYTFMLYLAVIVQFKLKDWVFKRLKIENNT